MRMNCKWEYKGQVFTSEAALDEYLLSVKALQPKLGDIVFKLSTHQQAILNRIKEKEKLVEKANIKEVIEPGPDGEGDIEVSGGFKHVTALLHEIRRVNDSGENSPLYPIFIGDNYWNGTETSEGQKSLYRRGDFSNPKVQAQIPFIEDLLEKEGNSYKKVTKEETLEQIRKRMEDVWVQQAMCGNLVHDLLSECYKRSDKGDWISPSTVSEAELTANLLQKIQKDYYDKYRDYLTPEHTETIIKSVIREVIKIDSEIHKVYGSDCMILSEKKIVGYAKIGNNQFPVVGKMDLFVASRDGKKLGIYDYKCSPKEYTEYNPTEDPSKYDPAKVATFQYQLAAYRKLLNSIGIIQLGNEPITLGVIPLQFQNYKFNYDTKKVEFTEVTSQSTAIQILSNTSLARGGERYLNIESNLEQIFPKNNSETPETGSILEKVAKNKEILFKIPNKRKSKSREDIIKYMKEKGGIQKNKITGYYEFRYKNRRNQEKALVARKKDISKSEAEAIILEKLQNIFEFSDTYVPNTTSELRKSFIHHLEEEGEPVDLSKLAGKHSYTKEDPLWLTKRLGTYNNPSRYSIIHNEQLDPVLDEMGILLFKNKLTGLIDVIKITGEYDPTMKAELGGGAKNRTTIFGNFLIDDVVNSDSNAEALDSSIGNVELMEAMLVLNELPELFNVDKNEGIGKIHVVSPRSQMGLETTNEQALKNFNRLCSLGKIKHNFYTEANSNGSIYMADRVTQCYKTFQEILDSDPEEQGLGKIYYNIKSQIKTCLPDFVNWNKNPQILRQELIDLDNYLIKGNPELGEVGYANLNKETGAIQDENLHPEYKLHREITFAIAQLSGVALLQQTEASSRYSITGGSTELDNPGTLKSKTLNQFTDQVTKAYQNVRDNVIEFNQELRKRTEALKKAKGFGKMDQYGVGNQVSELYMHMYDEEAEDFRFKNPWDPNAELDGAEREFLKFALLKINDNRIKGFNPENIEALIAQDPGTYLRVPMVKGDLASQVAVREGWLNYFKYKFAQLSPKNILERIKRRFDINAQGLLNSDQKQQIEEEQFWEAINSFEATEHDLDHRDKLLSDPALGGEPYFEHNIETILLKQTSAYKMAEELNNIFPVLRALNIHLNLQGAALNDKFTNDLEYILKYVKTRIHNQPWENRKDTLESVVADTTKLIMSTASKFALAFNPRQWYQIPDGIWKDIQIYCRTHPDEGTPFTKEGLLLGWKLAMSDMTHFGNDFTRGELLNQQYGFNDMDANSYIERIKTDNTGFLYHFWSVGFRFASRPDYYNRMTLFYAQMHKDGSLDAHKMVDGKLVYDWTKDKRFDVFAKAKGDISKVPPVDIKKFNEQKSLYISMARQFEQEGVKASDGTPFHLDLTNPMPIPKAYTNRQSESMKALSDRIYGYYAHEKKSLIHSSLVGSLLMQMNTYWSAKKNQYAQTRTFTQEGDWVDYEEDGFKYCWKQDESGDLIPTRIEKPEDDTGVPVKIWKGKPQEGIFITWIELGKALLNNTPVAKILGVNSNLTDKSGMEGVRDILTNEENPNVDPQVRKIMQANVIQLISDLIIWLIIGNLLLGSVDTSVKEYAKEVGNSNLGNALTNNGLALTTSILKASTEDTNFMKSIFGRGKQWTPFAIQSADRLLENSYRLVSGKSGLWEYLTRTSGAGKSFENSIEWVKLSLTDRKLNQYEKSE